MESRLLRTPRIGAQYIVGEDVGRVRVSVRDRKARAAGTLDVFGLGLSTELVISVWFYRDELGDSCFRGTLPIEGDGKRPCSAVKLTRVDGQGSMWVRFVPPVKSTVQQVLLESPVYDQVLCIGEIRLKHPVNV